MTDIAEERLAADRLRALQRVTSAALAHLELDELIHELLVRIRDVLHADTAALLLLDAEAGDLVATAAQGLEENEYRGIRIPLGRGFAGRIAAERRTIEVPDVPNSYVLNPVLRRRGLISLLGTPLRVGDGVIGVLHVGTLTARKFTHDDYELLELVAARAALAISHGRLFEEQRALADRLRKLQAVTDAALANLSVDDLLDELIERVCEILGADTGAILLLDDIRRDLVARAARGLDEEVDRGVRIPVGHGFAGRVASERRAIAIGDLEDTDVDLMNPLLRAKGIRSLLGVPLVAGDDVLGVIHVGALEPRRFTREEIDLLERAADRAAMGVQKALVHEELIRLDQVRHRFISIASHELRTPASAILGAIETLETLHDRLDAESERQLRTMLLEQSRRLVALLEQLLDISRLEVAAVEIKPERVAVREHLDRIVRNLAQSDEAVQVEAPPSLEIEADPAALDRIVSNLVVNALRHGESPIVVSAQPSDSHVRIAVEDRGRGVAADFRPRLFEQFARADDAAGRPGTGLGLAIARSYAHAHGGELFYEDASPSGARFVLVLPARAA